MIHAVMTAARRRHSGMFERQAAIVSSRNTAAEHDTRGESLEERVEREAREAIDRSSAELMDVPAAVVCAFCGDADCTGACERLDDLSRSGIVAVIAWERPGVPLFTRLWSTARSTTHDAETFFELLPDGPLTPAFRFAAICELCASTAAFLSFLAVAAVIAPEWLLQLALDPEARSVALRVIVLGLPAFAGMLVLAHAAHGLSIDMGATRNGARGARSRALRFGLYACGWDLVMGPLGVVVVAVKEGLRASLNLASSLSGIPRRATQVFLRGCYRLDGDRAKSALSISYVGASIATFMFALVILAAVTALVFV